MATTPTAKLGIPLPVAGSGEPFTVAAYNFGVNALDGAAGFTVCTSVTRPVSPWLGQSIFETDTGSAFVWDGSAWQPAGGGGSIEISSTAPTSPGEGDLWWDSDNGKLYIYYNDGNSSQWVDAAGPSVAVQSTAPTGYEGQLWLDDTDGSMYVYYTDPGGANSQWIGAVSRSGGILQVVQGVKTDTFTTTSTSFTAVTGLSATITPRSTSSKILVMAQVSHALASGAGYGHFRFSGGNTSSYVGASPGSRIPGVFGGAVSANANGALLASSMSYLDSPNTTSSVTYGVEVRQAFNGSVVINAASQDDNDSSRSRGASSITLIEVAG
jgi:hypothetical protein